MEYFQVGIRLPDSMFWVNLRPDAPDDIIDPYLSRTDMGRIMLEADLQLKKDLARFTSPDTKTGRQYWDKTIRAGPRRYSGNEDISIPTVTRRGLSLMRLLSRNIKTAPMCIRQL